MLDHEDTQFKESKSQAGSGRATPSPSSQALYRTLVASVYNLPNHRVCHPFRPCRGQFHNNSAVSGRGTDCPWTATVRPTFTLSWTSGAIFQSQRAYWGPEGTT